MERVSASTHTTLNTGPVFPSLGLAKVAFEIPPVSNNVIDSSDDFPKGFLLNNNVGF
jgi:hypothetical protein